MNTVKSVKALRNVWREGSITQYQYQYTAFRSILLGAGLCYAISEEKYVHIPVTFIFPSVYAGYQIYKNRDSISKYVQTLNTPPKAPLA